jgi:hypothetical protein
MNRGKAGLALGVSILSLMVLTGSAGAINCHSWGCVNRMLNGLRSQINGLHSQLNGDEQYINTLSSCLMELPVSEFGSPVGTYGYVYNNGTGSMYTTALDVPAGSTTVNNWVMYDSCNTQVLASVRRAHSMGDGVFGPIAPEAQLPIFQPASR